MNAQLSLLEPDEPDRISTGELVASTPPGPERLLRELVKRGLQQDALPEAARLLLAWHAFAPVDPDFRICACGCRRSLKGSAGHSQILRWCLSRQGPQGQKSVYPNPDPQKRGCNGPTASHDPQGNCVMGETAPVRFFQAIDTFVEDQRAEGRMNSPDTEREYRGTLSKHAEDVDNATRRTRTATT